MVESYTFPHNLFFQTIELWLECWSDTYCIRILWTNIWYIMWYHDIFGSVKYAINLKSLMFILWTFMSMLWFYGIDTTLSFPTLITSVFISWFPQKWWKWFLHFQSSWKDIMISHWSLRMIFFLHLSKHFNIEFNGNIRHFYQNVLHSKNIFMNTGTEISWILMHCENLAHVQKSKQMTTKVGIQDINFMHF